MEIDESDVSLHCICFICGEREKGEVARMLASFVFFCFLRFFCCYLSFNLFRVCLLVFLLLQIPPLMCTLFSSLFSIVVVLNIHLIRFRSCMSRSSVML
jgi:hypothetical protein